MARVIVFLPEVVIGGHGMIYDQSDVNSWPKLSPCLVVVVLLLLVVLLVVMAMVMVMVVVVMTTTGGQSGNL